VSTALDDIKRQYEQRRRDLEAEADAAQVSEILSRVPAEFHAAIKHYASHWDANGRSIVLIYMKSLATSLERPCKTFEARIRGEAKVSNA